MYHFYGWQDANVCDARGGTPRDLYDELLELWDADTCAPRMRDSWREENPTLGQCSITAFLVQDIYGGRVYGVPLGDGNYHCFNVVGTCTFDLTSEQFGTRVLDYAHAIEQFREEHFAKDEKRRRYELLRARLLGRRQASGSYPGAAATQAPGIVDRRNTHGRELVTLTVEAHGDDPIGLLAAHGEKTARVFK